MTTNKLRLLLLSAMAAFALVFLSGCPGEECGAVGGPCCSEGGCSGTGVICNRSSNQCELPDDGACGMPGQSCCEEGPQCRTGYECSSGFCDTAQTVQPCGGSGEMCCAGSRACDSADQICTRGTCRTPSCGFPTAPCCSGTGTPCMPGLSCRSGRCATMTGACGEVGQACCPGNACNSGTCCGGQCVDTSVDSRNCGSCARSCEGGECNAGECSATCGGRGEACCPGDTCTPGTECQGGVCSPPATGCGLAQDSCSDECCEGLDCSNVFYWDDADMGRFRTGCCASRNAPCARDHDCCGWMLCDLDLGECAPRQPGETCEGDNECDGGLVCIAGTCETTDAPPPPDCSATECGACNSSAGCGWCADSSQCAEANAAGDGPASGSCAAWVSNPMLCGGGPPDCEAMDCSSCTLRLDCGWCDGTDTCMEAGDGESADGTCTGEDWAMFSPQCPEEIDECGEQTTCGNCNYLGGEGCGWCADDETCRAGTSAGPNSGSCADWQPTQTTCSDEDCTGAPDCDICVTRTACGFCGDTGECVSGTTLGPNRSTCMDWSWTSEECSGDAPCDFLEDCETCSGTSGCGWCAGSGTCEEGVGDPATCGDFIIIPAACS